MVLVIMVIIGLAVENNLWLYLALGLAVLAKLSVLANSARVAASAAQSQTQVQQDAKEFVDNLLKSMQAKNN